MRIKTLKAKIIKNSRNENTIQITINKKFKASVPSGASTGTHEVKAYKKTAKYAVDYLNKHHDHWKNKSFDEFYDLETFENLNLGGNPILALQLTTLKAMSNNKIYKYLNPKSKILPTPLGNVIGGGSHTKLKSSDIQEFLLIPKAKTFKERYLANKHAYKEIKKKLNTKKLTDEGAFIPNISTTETLDFLNNYLQDKVLGIKINLGLDIAASEFYKNKTYNYKNFSKSNKTNKLKKQEQINLVNSWISDYNLKYVEDPLEQEDFRGFSKLDQRALICGDDLITTNIKRLKSAMQQKSINSIIIKPNQIGSLIKTKEIVDFAHSHNIKTIISHRSGETLDSSISHLAVAWKIPYIKTGIFGKERESKLKELLKIENEIKA
ncbi:hypothetical protein HN681_00045 [archaeon]|jgi:enolase|nr:hypothetical protein [archaeon]MBT3730661.1 hypothetical protein [archaeon]MBT5030320.1 hypothetical protein [archaeon]MBT5288387.1 hypothetical protein [archaeon]MBT7052499.1 hypothetical protein [archaeon]